MKNKFKQAYMDVAERFAQLSHSNKLKVGAIVVKDDRIISIGYNGMPTGWDNDCENVVVEESQYEPNVYYKSKPQVLHAESNAIAKVAKSNESCDNAAIFCTHAPCLECAKLIHQSGITSVYYKQDYDSLNYGSGIEFLNLSQIYVEMLTNEDSVNN
jgi:dCMP deaminase